MRTWALALVVLSSTGCFIAPDCRVRAADAAVPPQERRAAAETDAFVAAELAAWRAGLSGPERLDRAARAVGASGYAELAALAARDCLEPRDAERFASARGLGVPTAESVLGARFGVRVCGR